MLCIGCTLDFPEAAQPNTSGRHRHFGSTRSTRLQCLLVLRFYSSHKAQRNSCNSRGVVLGTAVRYRLLHSWHLQPLRLFLQSHVQLQIMPKSWRVGRWQWELTKISISAWIWTSLWRNCLQGLGSRKRCYPVPTKGCTTRLNLIWKSEE